MKDFFYGIETLFVDYFFAPFDALRAIEMDSWWISNVMSWLFFALGLVAFFYWMRKLAEVNTRGEEDRSSTSHSFLG
ncbi:MAG: uracil phosphoribosyltransferase [Bacteroidia bacterium]|nr:uracil phosphoribosyltransferase [Bacteroidia bacterium]NNF31527.1 uracil phosphoribosyltransferase [Flavobacteriaceae bacterium]MBT8275602.1 uracil phosphoribosyltransferase [Bacteroidia bacterium]NNJ82792.1 uracil phosphoribosyltransferase [Flavobacteriaceae bacterium]NNK54106.1 uracil phosphoribosyltransferase [Flavobacteriaceae bacterium]